MPSASMPALVAHADWGSKPNNRRMALAVLEDGRYVARAPVPVGDTKTLLGRLRGTVGEGSAILVGFDFPIGLPGGYARRAGAHRFLDLLPELGRGDWAEFYRIAEGLTEIGPRRPFYPYCPGGTKKRHLFDALGVESEDDLLRRCERAYTGRDAASSLFWTLGPKQVGRAAIIGWRDVLAPALASDDIVVWPFQGQLRDLIATGGTVVAETYQAEFYGHFGIVLNPGKRYQRARRGAAAALLEWAEDAGVEPFSGMREVIEDGFGDSPTGEDDFDATVGLFGMLNVVLGRRAPGNPDDEQVRNVEGWMLGQAR